jgi:hypothetical protein
LGKRIEEVKAVAALAAAFLAFLGFAETLPRLRAAMWRLHQRIELTAES